MMQRNKSGEGFKWLKRAAWVISIILVIQLIYITADGLNSYQGNADVAIILGNRVYENGKLSSWLQTRVDKAVELYRDGKLKMIYASGGGVVNEKNGSQYPEGDAMRLYLLKQGIPDSVIVADNEGQNTYLTAKDFLQWNDQKKFGSAIVVSQFYHITRSKYILRKLGFENVYGASADRYFWQDVPGLLREVPAFYKYVFFH